LRKCESIERWQTAWEEEQCTGEMRSGEGDRDREIGKDKIKVHVNAWQIG